MKYRIFFWAITSALAGFLFGFDTVVISGAEQKIQALWGLSAGMHGLAMGSFTHWIFAALLTTFFPTMVKAFAPGYIFLFFCFMMVLQLVWVKFFLPETKGISLEAMQHKLGIE